MIQPDFACWSHTNLVQFANETYARVIDDVYEIECLKQDLKAAIQAYRQVNTKGDLHDTCKDT
jgi:hypothetical protein